ncbi:hypothetical protein C8034_v004048 [Colletotrichum sidae]|uniref:Uncharacterized protein n=1 Tax=Colletotrichum sidae TaxID=1347389 RepID=A0A4R8T7J3_9PEZI|nr:hypothetical protein C8034_v004048 [Colletotrichum sidae]
MAHVLNRLRVPALGQTTRAIQFARYNNAVSGPRFVSDKPGLESTDIRDVADARPTSPPKPKVSNASVTDPSKLSDEQKREVEEHNKDFDAKHDRSQPAEDDKVDKKFWQSGKTEGGV